MGGGPVVASQVSPWLDTGGIGSHGNTKADDVEDETATVTDWERHSANVVQTVKADNKDPRLDPEFMILKPDSRPISQEQLADLVKGIYDDLVGHESKCTKVDKDYTAPASRPLDVTRYLLMIPSAKLILLQNGDRKPGVTVRTWFIKAQKDTTEGDKKLSALESTKELPAAGEDLPATPSATTDKLPTIPKDCPATPEEAAVHTHVSEKIAPQVGSPEDYLHGFLVALELRAKELEWPEYEELAARTTAEIGEEGRKKVIDGKCFLYIGYELVDQLLRDLETAEAKAEAAEQEATQAKEENKDLNPDPEATPTLVGETQDDPEAQSRLSNDTQQAAPKETSPKEVEAALEEAFEVIAPEEAEEAFGEIAPNLSTQEPQASPVKADADTDAALEEAATTQQHSAQDANLSAQEPHASARAAGVAPENSGKNTADTAVDTITLTKSKSKKKVKTKGPIYVEDRPLHDKSLYKKVGQEYWVLVEGQWTSSLTSEQFAALTKLHRTLLHKHYDFFLASQHPTASKALRRLAVEYSMPARMWRHAIHSFLKLMLKRLCESQEFMGGFIITAYNMMFLLEETVPRFLDTWFECRGDLARYRMATQTNNQEDSERWRSISKDEYTRALYKNPTIGRLYHHRAILERSQTVVSPDKDFDATVSQLFYYLKSLVVKAPFFASRESVLIIIKPIVARNEEAVEKPASIFQTDNDHFLTAVVHLILASMGPETLRENGYKDGRKDHLQAVYAALEKIKVGGPVKTSRIRPSAKLGLLLCQLLLGIPLADKRWSPMMAAWAPDFVTAEDRADPGAMANARDIHDATIELIRTMVPYLLKEADTRDLGVWGFIYIMLVFMRSLKTRPALLEWFGSAFHAKLLASFLNMLLREDETRGSRALESASQSELVTFSSLLNEKKKPGKYGFSTEDNIRKYHREQEEQRKAERASSTATAGEVTVTPEESTAKTEETATSDAAHEMDGDTGTPDRKQVYANVLPEHSLLSGLFFAQEAEHSDESLEDPTKDATAVASPPAPEATLVAVQTAGEPAVEQAQEGSSTGSETDREAELEVLTDPESENEAEDELPITPEPEIETQEEQQTEKEAVEAQLAEVERKETENEDARQQDAQTKEVGEAEKTQEEDEQKVRETEEARLAEEKRKEREAKEAEEAGVRRREGLRRDPPLFPKDWFKKSKHSLDEARVLDYVQNVETYNDRSIQILRLAAHLNGDFFIFKMDREGLQWISVPGASSVPKPDPNKKMPEIIERDGGVRVVYVNPSFHTAEIEREKKTLAREEERRKEKERQKGSQMEKDAKATMDVATAINEKAEGDAEEVSAANNIPETSQSNDTIEQRPVQSGKPISHEEGWEAVTVSAGVPSTVSEYDDNELIPAYDMEPDKTSRIWKSTTAAEKPSSTHDAEPTQLTEGVLNKIRGMEAPTEAIERWRAPNKGKDANENDDDEDWTHVSDGSHGDTRSMFSRLFFG